MTETDKLLARIGTARDAISRKTEQTSLDYMIDGVLMNCSVLLKENETDIEALKKSYNELAEKGEPVVRCKDCKWWDKKDGANYGYCHACKHGYYSDHWEIGIYRTYKGDFFCADGERKEVG